MRKLFWLTGAALIALPASAQTSVSEVVVTGAPYVVSMDSTTTSVDVLRRDDLDTAVSGGLGDVLARVPGVRSSFFGPGASRPVIRGLSGPRVLVLTNGIGLIDASGLSPDHQVAGDPQEAERIEVLRGPAALAYGGSAIGGAVNIIDERVPSTFEPGLHGRALGVASTVDDGNAASGALRYGLADHWSFTVDAVHRTSEDYEVPTNPISHRMAATGAPPAGAPDRVLNSAVELDAYGAGFSYVADGGWGGLAAKWTESRYGSPAERDVSIALEQTRVDARGGLDLSFAGFEALKVAAGWADYTHTEFEGAEVGTTFLSQGYEGRLELVQPDRGGWQGAVGVQGLRRDLDAIGEEALIPLTRIQEVGGFVLQRLDREGWGVEGGARVDRRELRSLVGRRDFTNVSGSIGLFARPSEGWFIGLSLSRTSRAPTEGELFSNGAHPATGAFEIGDADLTREVSNSLEATAHYASERWSVDLHAFAVDYDNFIDLVPTGVVDVDSELPVFVFVEGGASFRGAEAEISYLLSRRPGGDLRLQGALDYVGGSTASGPAARMPPWSATLRLA
ncbi:MAG TPA: TonB-dependent receptor, partial [Phenylobacterium sp.]